MTLLDDLDDAFWDHTGRPSEVYYRLRYVLSLLSHPGARTWLAALPGLLELGEKATPGEWEPRAWVNSEDPAWAAVGPVHECEDEDCDGDCSCPGGSLEAAAMADARLISALRNALHSAAGAAQEGGEG